MGALQKPKISSSPKHSQTPLNLILIFTKLSSMSSRVKRKASATEKGKNKASSSSIGTPNIFHDHLSKELERYQKFYHSKIVQTPKYGELSLLFLLNVLV